MAIDVVSVQYNGGFLPDIIILLNQCYYHRETRLNALKRFRICSLWSHLPVNVLTFSPLTGGCSKGLDYSLTSSIHPHVVCRSYYSLVKTFYNTNIQYLISFFGLVFSRFVSLGIIFLSRFLRFLEKNQNAPRPSEQPPVRGKKCQNV